MKNIITACFLIIASYVHAQVIKGTIYDAENSDLISFVDISNKTIGAQSQSDLYGYFEIQAQEGVNLIQFNFLGYSPKTYELNYPQDSIFNPKLSQSTLEINEVVVEGKSLNLGKKYIKKAIEAKSNRKTVESYSAQQYEIIEITQHFKTENKEDSTAIIYIKEELAQEYIDQTNYKKVIQYEEEAFEDNSFMKTAPMIVDRDFRGSRTFVKYNPLNLFQEAQASNIDVYDDVLKNASISDRPISSPLGRSAFINYSFRLTSVEEQAADSILTIQFTPRFKESPLWEGELTMRTSDQAVLSVQLDFPTNNTGLLRDLSILYEYESIEGSWMIPNRTIEYKTKSKNVDYDVRIEIKKSEIQLDPEFDKNFFTREQVRYEETALIRDSLIFEKYRPKPFTIEQKNLVSKSDSIYNEINSKEYLAKEDSTYNHLTWRNYLFGGIHKRYRSKGFSYYVSPVLQLFNPFGIGGLRITPEGGIEKEYPNSNQLDVDLKVDYGYRNNDWKGRVKVGFMFLPQKFARIYGRVGDTYDFITTYQSFDVLLSRSNYVRNTSVGGGYAMEIWNGVFMNSDINYSDKRSIKNLNRSPLLDSIFGSLNFPADFPRYKAFIWDTDFTIKFKQDYVTRGRKKILLPNYLPVLKLKYTKGIPRLFLSEVNFDYVQASVSHKMPQSKLGSLSYQARVGSYVNKRNLRFAEYNFFRGSTPYIMTSPLEDFQLLGPTLSTPNTFFETSAIHHFNGFFLDKIPLLNKLQMELLAGGGILAVPDQDFLHIELFAGIGKKFLLFGETIQIALYYLTADSSQTALEGNFKIGFNFYNAFAKEWAY